MGFVMVNFGASYQMFLIDYYRKIGEIEKSCAALENFLRRFDHRKYYYMIAFDGALKLAEGCISEAHFRFEECLRNLPDDESADSRYVALFCKCALSLRDSKVDWRRIRREAMQLRPSRKIRQFLAFPSEEIMSKIIIER